MDSIRYIIAEKNYLIRKGLKCEIEKNPHTQVVKEIDSELNIEKVIDKYKADVLFINPLLLPERRNNILSFFKQKNKMIVYPIFYSQEMIHPPHTPQAAIVCDAPSEIIMRKIEATATGFLINTPASKKQSQLTKREITILKLIATGLTNRQIGEKLFISEHTVIVHRKHITKKLDIKSVSGLTVYAVLNKLIDVNDM